jgi:hypothetical protein
LTEETEVLTEQLLQCHFFHYKSQMIWSEIESRPPRGKPATNRLSYGVVFMYF